MQHSSRLPYRPALRGRLMHSVSLTALLVAGAAGQAQAGSAKSITQALASRSTAAVASAATGGGATAAQAANLGAQNVANAAAKFRSLDAALAAETDYSGPDVPNGVGAGGLLQAPGVAGSSNSSTLWSGASTTLTQTVANGLTNVTVTQTSAVAALQWASFNIGAKTTLTFKQGGSTWIAINEVSAGTTPSVILGDITAPGKVYILNQNGILFGAGSQVNLAALVASTDSIASSQFTYNANNQVTGFTLYGAASSTGTYAQSFVCAATCGSVIVQAGADIATPSPTGSNGGGYVMLLGSTVENDGVITTPRGQTVLAAGNNVFVEPGFSSSNVTATVIGSQVAVSNNGSITGSGTTALGAVTNAGIILADQGDITMVGHLVTQAGIIASTTTVDNRGTVHLLTDTSDTTAAVVLAPGSITEVLPEDDGETALDSQRATDLANSILYNADRQAGVAVGTPVLNDANRLADEIGESRIEISTGGTVTMAQGALALAQGGQVAVGASSILMQTGATIDVSGTNAYLPASFNSLNVDPLVPYTLRDSAANRTGGLEFGNVYIDERTLVDISFGTVTNVYTKGGLLEVGGELGLIGHGIDEWSSIGGQVILQAVSTTGSSSTGGTVLIAPGATINLTGGTVTYGAGFVQQSYVVAADGEIYNINDAPGDLVYTSVYTGTQDVHSRWHITDTYINPLLTPAEIYEPEYTIGRDAGTLTVTAATGILDGTVQAGVTVGTDQTAVRPATVTDPFLLAQNVAPLAGELEVGDYIGGTFGVPFSGNIVLGQPYGGSGNGTPPVVTAVPDTLTGTISVGAALLGSDGFSRITLSTGGDITVASATTLADGGALTLSGATIEVNADITAHAGQIALINVYPTNELAPVATVPGSITVSSGVTLDTSGQWTNLSIDPNNTTQAGFANAGSVTIIGTGGVDLQAGSVIDVSSGGVLSTTGKLTAASGGSVSISADIVPTLFATLDQFGAVTYAATLLGYGSGGAGTLSLSAPEVVVGANQANYFDNTLVVGQSLFNSGFADYQLNGYLGLSVDSGLQINVTRPVYELTNPAVATGAPAAAAYSVVLPSLYAPVKGGDTFTQRGGASVTLAASVDPAVYDGNGGALTIGAGAHITVDPGQSITVDGYGQVTDLGTLTAHGGTITVANTRYENAPVDNDHDTPTNYAGSLSVWIGDAAVIDVSGVATVFTDALGRRFGSAQNGGAIFLGGLGGLNGASPESTYAQVIVRPGALLNASGAAAVLDVSPGLAASGLVGFSGPVTVAGNGGLIAARSYDGIAFDGTLLAAGQGAGAAGGTLAMRIDPQYLSQFYGIPQSYIAPSQILISQDFVPVQTEAGLAPGDAADPATIGLGRISQQQLTEGGFDTLRLYAQDDIAFDGAVNLQLGRSITLESGIVGETQGHVAATVTAPYVDFIGFSNASDYNGGLDQFGNNGNVAGAASTTATLTVNADLIDFTNSTNLGGIKALAQVASQDGQVNQPPVYTFASTYGFSQATFNSAGDIRFNGDVGGAAFGILASSGNITFRAAQLFPTTSAPGFDVEAEVLAGYNPRGLSGVDQLAGGTLTVLGLGGAAPAVPFSVDGTLALFADTVIQDGVVRAPEGVLEIGEPRTSGMVNLQITNDVELGPNSISSVSLDSATIPYGGTVDGVNYLYDGSAVSVFNPVIELAGVAINVQSGATVDISGGGTLAGAGFIAGRGGSTDVNVTPLLNSGSGTVAANTTDPIFAIVPGYGAQYAPVAPANAGYSAPTPGEQITIAAGEIPGLAAGTYTLLPAYYDLLPGAYRVELTGSTIAAGTTQSFGNFTTVAAVTLGTANSAVVASLPEAALITPATEVRQLSQYDEENYSTFETNAAATFDSPRPVLPGDGKTLLVSLSNPLATTTGSSTVTLTTSLAIAPGTLDQTTSGYGATMELISNADAAIELLGPGGSVVPVLSSNGSTALPTIGIDAAELSALDLPRLVIGGTLSISSTTPNLVAVEGVSQDVILEQGADLKAGDILLNAGTSGQIIVSSGATMSTLGEPTSAFGLAQGFYFTSDANGFAAPVLGVSNGQIVFASNVLTANGAAITVDAGAVIAGAGSLNFVAPSGTSVQVGESSLTARYVDLQVADINIGSATDLAAFAGVLPAGLTLSQETLNTLAQSTQQLILTAQEAVNMIGSVALNSGNTDLVLNTPALYGYGVSNSAGGADAGVVTITAPNFTWGGVATGLLLQNSNETTVSATPGGRLAGSVATSGGTLTLTDAASLTIAAKTIDLGYGPNVRVDDQVQLQRLALGFGLVTLAASTDITANNQSALSVYQDQAEYGQPGTGGNLILASPLITTASGAVLGLAAGGTLTANTGVNAAGTAAAAPSATGSISTLGGEIDITAGTVDTSTSFALPAGKLSITAQTAIDLEAGTTVDLSGRATKLFDQTADSNGGTLILQAYAGDGGTITEDAGASINVSSPGANAGDVTAIASGGNVDFNGSISGTAGAGSSAGSFTVFANALTNTGTAASAFDLLNETLTAGGFFGARSFELASGNLVVDQTVQAHNVSIGVDAGSLDISGTIDASGSGPGSISLSAADTLTLESTAVLDAHATTTAKDSYGEEIDSENRAHVTLTSANGEVLLDSGATINVSYPDASNVQGQVAINAPRLSGSGTLTDVAVAATGSLNIIGAQSIDLYAYRTYTPNQVTGSVVNGTVVQDNGQGSTAGNAVTANGTIGLVQIDADSQAFMTQVNTDVTTLTAQLAGLVKYGSSFNLLPGVIIASTATGNLTISGDLDFSGFRYSDPMGFGTGTTTVLGSGEPGAIVFRSANDLIINGSVSDGFQLPPDATTGTLIGADTNGWEFLTPGSGGFESTNQDLLLPQGALAVYTPKGGQPEYSSTIYLVGSTNEAKATAFDTTRPISLNYSITIDPANILPNVLIPFTLTIGSTSAPIPTGGWVATSSITRNGVVLYNAGQLIPAGFTFQTGDILGAGAVLPIPVQTGVQANATGQVIPAGTSFSIFSDSDIYLSATVALAPNALIPALTLAIFGGKFDGSSTVQDVTEVAYRGLSEQFNESAMVQGYLFPLAQLLPAGDLSWSMNFVSGANLSAAAADAVLPTTTLYGGVFAPPAQMTDAAPGSLLIDDLHNLTSSANPGNVVPAFSVIRTGTGDLSLVAGGDVDQASLYGIYTAGTEDPLGGGEDAQFNSAREPEGGANLLPGSKTVSELIQSTYQAYYPNGGGDFLLAAQGNVTSDVFAEGGNTNLSLAASDLVGNWLWRQGSTQLGQPTSWWINYGTLVAPLDTQGSPSGTPGGLALTGFIGFGTLGGGNVTVNIGGNAGQMTDRDEGQTGGSSGAGPTDSAGEGLVIAVGGTGRLLPGTTAPITTGGGLLDVTIGGTLNPLDAAAYGAGGTATNTNAESASVNGDLVDVRGDINVDAGQIGRIDYQFNIGSTNQYDPRTLNPFAPDNGTPNGGIEIIPGDGTVSITTDRDLVVQGSADPGRIAEQSVTDISGFSTLPADDADDGGYSGFSLWSASTAISLFSAGGNVTPTSLPNTSAISGAPPANTIPTDYRSIYPSTLLVTAATGDIIYGQTGHEPSANSVFSEESLETMPSADGEVAFLAGGSIYANGYAVDLSGANPAGLSLPTDPAFSSNATVLTGELTNIRGGVGTDPTPLALFALEADTPTTDLHANDPVPARFYAATGDIVNFQTGETIYFDGNTTEPQSEWYIAAKPVWIIAGNDIVSSGSRPAADPNSTVFGTQENQIADQFSNGLNTVTFYSSGNLFLNTSSQSVSLIQAGRDILSTYAYVGGPGLLDVTAGRNIYQAGYAVGSTEVLEFGSFKSLGDNLITGSQLSSSAGANIDVLAGVGSAGPDDTAFANDFLNPTNAGDIYIPTHDKALQASDELMFENILPEELAAQFGISLTPAAAYAYLKTLPAQTQASLVQNAFFTVLQYAATQETSAGSIYYKSYKLGRDAIDALFPSIGHEVTPGAPAGYTGAITMYSGDLSVANANGTDVATTFDGGIATLFGGTVQVLDPGGAAVFGIAGGPAPGNSSGIVTYGSGSIDIYTLGSVLLGQSRIFTTGGGNILIWSSSGDINAGIGAKTTVVYNPPELLYDDQGDITETPPANTSGAGIATLQPLPDVPAGDVSLAAPLGTIDPGEAGVRVSGNLTLAAAHVVTTNISVKGSTAGAPTVSVASLGAVQAASASAGASSNAAESQGGRNGSDLDAASVVDVEVVSIGGSYDEEQKRRKRGL